MKVLFTGGGSGGHIAPIIAIAREMKKLPGSQHIAMHYIGPNDPFWLSLLSKEGIKTHAIVSGKIRKYFSFHNFIDLFFKIPIGILQSFFLLVSIKPDLVLSKGGTGSYVVCLSAKMLKIPVFLHESDLVPGSSNKEVSKWAEKIFVSFSHTEHFNPLKMIFVGNPINKELLEGNLDRAKEIFNLTSEKPVLLFLGGSQGAKAINGITVDILVALLKNYEIIHVCGTKNYQEVFQQSNAILNANKDLERYYHLFDFLDQSRLKHALKAASLIVSRAGSGSIFEIAACGKPSILIPLPLLVNGHQQKNAYQYSNTGSAITIEQENVTPKFLLEKIHGLFSNREKLDIMKEAALKFSKPMAAENIAKEILNYLNKK